MYLVYSLIVLFSLLITYSYFNKSSREGLENSPSTKSSCDSQTLIYQNAGSITNIKEQIDTLKTSINKLTASLSKTNKIALANQTSIRKTGKAVQSKFKANKSKISKLTK